jgi:hypothetical protein
MNETHVKDPEATRTFSVDWSDYLTALGGVTIALSEWTVPDGLVQEGTATNTPTVTKIKLSGGTVNTNYTVYNKITRRGDVQRTFRT